MNSSLSEGFERAMQQVILQGKALVDSLVLAIEDATAGVRTWVEAMNKEAGTIYVTVGHPKGDLPLQDKVAVIVVDKTKIQSAKMFRKDIARQYLYKTPSELYYVIFLYSGGEFRYFWSSDNAPTRWLEA